ncbi:MAG: histidine kinase [Leptospiraceae bacterium]|nr:histidine kinase [Leptospiraceae bacterium]
MKISDLISKKLNMLGTLFAFTVISIIPFLLLVYFHSYFYRIFDIQSYLIVHNLIEFFSAIVSFSIFGIGWYSYDQSKNQHSLFLSVSFLTIGMIDLMHTLGYLGMPNLITPNSENKSSQFWIVARFLSAVSFLLSAYIYRYRNISFLSRKNLMVFSIIFSFLVFITVTFFQDELPATFIKGIGLTSVKKNSEYLIIFLYILATIVYIKRIWKTNDLSIFFFPFAFILCIIREFIFTTYESVFDTYNLLGHLYKIICTYIIYRAVFVSSVYVPYNELKNEVSEHLLSKEKITKSLKEKETLIRELYHRTKNTLHFIQSLIHLQAHEFNSNNEIKVLVKKTDKRIQSVALVQEMLYKSKDLSNINSREYIEELTGMILKGYHLENDKVILQLELDDQNILLDTAIPFGLIINELMTNTLNYAFPKDQKGVISLHLKNQDGIINFIYSDNGIGLPEAFDFRNQSSLGAKLIHILGEDQMKGNILIESIQGFSFQLNFPLNLYHARV